MRYDSFKNFLKRGRKVLAKGPVAMIFSEDATELDSCLRHHIQLGFAETLVFLPDDVSLPEDLETQINRITCDTRAPGMLAKTVNAVIAAAPDVWLYYCHNAEYLYFPFCETRSVGELTAFLSEERRTAMLTYVVDLYADDLAMYPDAVSLRSACLDRSGYYALARTDPANPARTLDRQYDIYGGLRWRFEEHVSETRRRIDRISLFRAKPGLVLRDDFTFNDDEMNTYACPWHNNPTAAIGSFRTAKALKRNPGSTYDIASFVWQNSVPFEWHSRQLLDLGLMEPGQWF